MVEIRYRDQYEVSELAGQTVAEAREQFKAEFGIPNKAQAKLNGSKVKSSAEMDTVLNDDDKLTFVTSRNKGVFLIGALLLALAITGGIFASGFINATVTLTATTSTNFADVSANSSGLTWSAFGFFKGSIGSGTLFNVDTATSGYTGDLVVTVSYGNADDLVARYRMLSLQLAMYDGTGSELDINNDNVGRAGDAADWVMLTLDNGSVSMFPEGTAGGDAMTVRVKKGFYITHVAPFSGGDPSPMLFCEVAQR
jgi:molybdopterin converting factor small subunit